MKNSDKKKRPNDDSVAKEVLFALRGCLIALDYINSVGGDVNKDTYFVQANIAREALEKAKARPS